MNEYNIYYILYKNQDQKKVEFPFENSIVGGDTMMNIQINDKVIIKSSCNSKGQSGFVIDTYNVGTQKYVMVQLKDRKQGYNVLSVEKIESEDNKMTGFSKVAIVNLVEDYSKKDYGFALYDEDINEIVKYDTSHPLYVVVNARGKDNRILGILKEIKTVEEYGKSVTAQVIGVVNMNAYNARIDEENRLKEIAKQKASIEKELKSEIEKMNNIALYEKMAKEHPENPRLAELVNALKELGE